MRAANLIATIRIALFQLGLAPRLLRRGVRRALSPTAVAHRRWRTRALGIMATIWIALASATLWPPSHGAVLMVTGPWVADAEIERRILAAGGVALGAQDGEVDLFGLRIGRIAIGADPSFAGRAVAAGALPVSAGPLFWIDEQLDALGGWIAGAGR